MEINRSYGQIEPRTYEEIERTWKAQMVVTALEHDLIMERIQAVDKLIQDLRDQNDVLELSMNRRGL